MNTRATANAERLRLPQPVEGTSRKRAIRRCIDLMHGPVSVTMTHAKAHHKRNRGGHVNLTVLLL